MIKGNRRRGSGRVFENAPLEKVSEQDLSLADAPPERPEEPTDDMVDSVGEYLRAIGRHPLLNVAQEISLGSSVQRWMRLRDLRGGLEPRLDRDAEPHELGALTWQKLSPLRDVLEAVAIVAEASTGESGGQRSMADTLGVPKVRKLLDTPITPELIQTVAGLTERPDDTIAPLITDLASLSS
ncbi:MAG: polymerase sigma factor, partial [Dehalococcoidia bacterium]|nr:polymerase sigma factor [Dehalococcoidia bacterium]